MLMSDGRKGYRPVYLREVIVIAIGAIAVNCILMLTIVGLISQGEHDLLNKVIEAQRQNREIIKLIEIQSDKEISELDAHRKRNERAHQIIICMENGKSLERCERKVGD